GGGRVRTLRDGLRRPLPRPRKTGGDIERLPLVSNGASPPAAAASGAGGAPAAPGHQYGARDGDRKDGEPHQSRRGSRVADAIDARLRRRRVSRRRRRFGVQWAVISGLVLGCVSLGTAARQGSVTISFWGS